MSNSVFKDCEPLKEDTMVILVNHDGSISVDHNSLQSLLTNKSASTSINVVRVSNNDNIGAANKDNELNIGVDNAEINSTIMPEVHFTLESYYSPEESRTIAANIMNFQGDVPSSTPLSLDTTDFNLFVIKNDHCYTPLTSPSQKLPVIIDSPPSTVSDDPKRRQSEVIKLPTKDVKRNLYNTKLSKPANNQNDIVLLKPPIPISNVKKGQELQDRSQEDLQTLLEQDDFDSEHMPSSESASSDDGSDADFNINERRSAKLRRGTKGFKGSSMTRTKSIKKPKRRKSMASAQHLEVESMLQAMEGGNVCLAKPTSRRHSLNVTKSVVEKKIKPKPVKISKMIKKEKTPPLEIAKSISPEQVLLETPKANEESKVISKAQAKKDKKPPAHVTEALFSDMTSLFSSPDIIKKVSTPPGRLSMDQRKSIDSCSESTSMLMKSDKVEKQKQNKDTTEDFISISSKESTYSLCESTDNNPKHLDFIDKFINGSSFPDQNSSLSVPPITSLPSLASILQASGATEAETNMDEATLLSNVVGVNLLDSPNKIPNPLEAVSIQALTNSDIPDSGPLSAVSAGSLDLEENTLLESLHNVGEDISEDFLMHITQTLVENSDIKAVIDKQLENPTTIEQPASITPTIPPTVVTPKPKPVESPFVKLAQAKLASKEAAMARKEPIQIVRSDGRIITLPPIEAPATRSKRKNQVTASVSNSVTPVTKLITPAVTSSKIDNIVSTKKADLIPVTVKKVVPEVPKKRARTNSMHKSVMQHSLPESEEDEEEDSDAESWRSEDDPDRLWCICQQPHNNRFMICCDKCEDWFHGKCVNITKAMGQQMEEQGIEWSCPNCVKKKEVDYNQTEKVAPNSTSVGYDMVLGVESAPTHSVPYEKSVNTNLNHTTCIVCKKEARASSIYCSDSCILKHAQVSLSIISKPQSADKDSNKSIQTSTKPKFQNIIKTKSDRVIVFERTTGRCLAGDSAPTVENLEHWLKENPTFEVVLKSGPNQQNIGKKIPTQVKNIVDMRKATPVKINQITLNNKLQKPYNSLKTTQKQIVLIQPPAKLPTPIKQAVANVSKPSAKVMTNQNSRLNVNKTSQAIAQQNAKTAPATPVKIPIPSPREKGEKPRVADTEPIRINVRKTLKEHLLLRSSENVDNKWSPDDIKAYCDEIENEMFNLFKDTDSKYKAKYRSLLFNIKDKKNFTLYKKICEGDITPKQLVRMSPDELASQELAQWRAKEAKHQLEMIKKSELDLLACAKTYVLKTHKGEEIMESRTSDMTEVDPTVAVEDVVSALNNSAVSSTSEPPEIETFETPTLLDRHKLKFDKSNGSKQMGDHKSKASSHTKEKSHSRNKSSHSTRSKDKSHDRDRDKYSERHSKSKGKDKKLSTEHKSRDKRNSKEKSPVTRRESSRRKSTRENMEKQSGKNKERKEEIKEKEQVSQPLSETMKDDSILSIADHTQDIELPKPQEDSSEEQPLTEGESYQEPTSTVTEFYGTEPSSIGLVEDKDGTEIWNGVVNMVDVAHFGVLAFQISGDCHDLAKDLPGVLDIVGRIGFSTVWEYIAKMKTSNTKDIIVIQLTPINEEERVPYVGLYTYLSTRKRLGVIKQTSSAIKDFYIYPLGKKDSIPTVLLPLSVNENSKEILPNTLLGIIVRARRKRPANMLSLPMPTTAKISRKLVSPPPKPFSNNKRLTEDQGYTPPTSPRPGSLKKLIPSASSVNLPPLTDHVKEKIAASLAASTAEDEPYSPGGSDNGETDLLGTTIIKPTLEADLLYIPSEEPSEIEKKMEELNRRIEEQKKQIQSMSAGIIGTHQDHQLDEHYSPSRPVTPDNTSIPALENISLPSNLQEILASIQSKTTNQPSSTSSYLPMTPEAVGIGIEDKYSPTAPSSYLRDKREFDLAINSHQGYNLGIKHLKNQIVGQPTSDVSLYTNKDNSSNLKSINQTDVSLNLPLSDIDERKSSQIFADVDDRIAFKLPLKDVDERFPPKLINDDMSLINTTNPILNVPPLVHKYQIPPPPITKPMSKLAQLSEEELLSMVPDDILSSPSVTSVDKMSTSNNCSDSLGKAKLGSVTQAPILYNKPPPVMLKDISFSQVTAELPINTGTSKRAKLEQPPPPGIESFFEEGDL